jgi:cbb3-type cytochrome oxidase subunit 1
MVWQLLKGQCYLIKNVNAISHFTDWTIAHVHVGALGWNGFLTFGVLYWIIPRIFRTELYSKKAANMHFWIGTLGIVLICSSNVLGRYHAKFNVERIYSRRTIKMAVHGYM